MKNNLSMETSPYLLQHAKNPVHWQPWGDYAFDQAKKLNRPVFLSIGYAACHWCHVMEKESFEDVEVARILNDHFVSIKVDREENPVVDQIYMAAVTALTGQGGWPMSMFLTPEGKPFLGGTYFPPVPRHGLPSFTQLILHVSELWQNDREKLFTNARRVTEFIKEKGECDEVLGLDFFEGFLEKINQKLLSQIDEKFSGWGNAPKFPQPMALTFLLNQNKADTNQIVFNNLEMLSRGGIFDVIGGGFHRYSVDARWRVPHFEKMLTDNALLSRVYLQAYKITKDPIFKRVCENTLDFILREMQDTSGGFYSSLDADSENREGIYYTWDYTQLIDAIPDKKQREMFFTSYGISPAGNFERSNVLQRITSAENLAEHYNLDSSKFLETLENIHKDLFQIRSRRVRPATDEKILTSWNAGAIQSLAEAGRYLQNEKYLFAAQKAAGFILKNLFINNELFRSWREEKVKNHAFLEDYASLILALLSLYQSDFDPEWFIQARKLTRIMLEKFSTENYDFNDVSDSHNNLIFKPQNLSDNAVPSGSSLAFRALLEMSFFEENSNYDKFTENALKNISSKALEYPLGYANWLQGIQSYLNPGKQIALIWSKDKEKPQNFIQEIWHSFQSNVLVAGAPFPLDDPDNHPSLLHNRQAINNEPTVYICQGFVCQKPIQDLEEFKKIL